MRVISDRVPIGLLEDLVPLGAEFLEGLGIDEFLELGLEGLLWGFFVAFGELYRFVCRTPSKTLIPGKDIKRFNRHFHE